MSLLLGGDTLLIIAFGVVLVGASQGAEVDLLAYLVARYFGFHAYGAIYGAIFIQWSIGIAAGRLVIGTLYNRFGNHDAALMLGPICCLVAAAALLDLAVHFLADSETVAD